MTNQEHDEVITIALEYLYGLTRSDAQGAVEAMSEDKKYTICLSIKNVIDTWK